MTVKIGQKIKELRKKQDVTQEKLAEYLNISYQAVSKWENGTAYPDITLVVPLANFFGVSTDELLCFDGEKAKEDIDEYCREAKLLRNQGRVREELALWRKAAEIYPNNYTCLSQLVCMLHSVACSNGFSKEEQNAAIEEGIILAERILADCTDNEIRGNTLQILAYLYAYKGDEEKAEETAKRGDSIWCSREMLLERVYKRDNPKRRKIYAENALSYLDILTLNIYTAPPLKAGMDIMQSGEEKIKALENLLNAWSEFFYDGNYLFYHCRIADIYGTLAALYAECKGDKENTLRCLKKAKYHAEQYDALPEGEINYTGVFFDGAVFERTQTSKNYTESETERLRKFTDDPRIDFMREDKAFVEFVRSFDK